MDNSSLIIEKNSFLSAQKIKMRDTKDYYLNLKDGPPISLIDIRKIIAFINSIKCRHKIDFIPIRIDLGERFFQDKYTYILLESILHILIESFRCKIETIFNCKHNIFNEGIQHSCLVFSGIKKEGREKFLRKYPKDINGTHFRRTISPEGPSQQISLLAQEIDYFLKNNFIVDECRNKIALIIAELTDNALEHANTECLVDIDITREYFKEHEIVNDGVYRGVNIVVMDYSETILCTPLREKVLKSKMMFETKYAQYEELKKAYDFHSQHWSSQYGQDDFFAIASFQNKISGRNNSCTGGKGLTELLNALQIRSDSYYCYCVSGNRMISLSKEYTSTGTDSWIGFNKQRDFFNALPDENCLQPLPFYFPGTAYNLNFVLKEEEGI